MKKYFSLIFLLTILLNILVSQEEEFYEVSIFVDSFDFIIQDLKGFLTESEIDEIKSFYYSKENITYRKLFEITGNQIVSKIIEKNLSKEQKFFKMDLGVNLDSLFSLNNKNFFKMFGRYKNFDFFLLTEKDVGEKRFYDNIKFGATYKDLIAGNYVLKTGRGLFSTSTNYENILNRVFYSNRIELDDSYSEYPSFFGLAKRFLLKNYIIIPFLSNVYYDCILDSLNNVKKILTYNIHDDSLSMSRDNNLRESSFGFLFNHKKECLNFATYFADYSKTINMIDSDKNIVFSSFGQFSLFSYDFGFSYPNRGYSLSLCLKNENKDFMTSSGFILNKRFFNLHSNDIEEKDFFGFFFDISKRKGLRFENRIDFVKGDYEEFKNSLTIRFVDFVKPTFSYDLLDKNRSSLKFEFFKSYNDLLSLKLTFFLNQKNSNYQKMDLFVKNKDFELSTYIYTYKILETDYISIYEYSFTNYYPLKIYRSGEGIVYGLNLSIKRVVKTNVGLVKNNRDIYGFYLLLNYSLF
ncbi:MAG: hypothetical protein WHT27_05900 [candidate division WOR-3 bacterium]